MISDPSGLRTHQVANAASLLTSLRRFGAGLDASETGTGKTYTAIAIARELDTKPLIVCPKAVMKSWHRVADYLGGDVFTVNYEKLIHANPWGQIIKPDNYEYFKEKVTLCQEQLAAWLIVPPANPLDRHRVEVDLIKARKDFAAVKARRKFVWNKGLPLIIFDEAHRCKAQNTLNAKMMFAAKRQNIPTLALSATPASSPLDMRALGYLLALHNGVDFWTWCKRYGCREGSWGKDLQFVGSAESLKAIHRQIFPDRGVRTTREELGDEFPESQIETELYDLEGAETINALYLEMEDALGRLKDRMADDKDEEHPLTALLRLRQKVELIKIPVFEELAADAVEDGMSVPIFVNFSETVTELRKRLKCDCFVDGTQRGDKGMRDRQECIDKFQSGEQRIIICNQKAGGVGIGLHDVQGNFPRMALVSPTFSAIDLTQTLGRVWRDGSKTKSMQRIILAAGTVEEEIHRRLQGKLRNLSLIQDGDLNHLLSKQAA